MVTNENMPKVYITDFNVSTMTKNVNDELIMHTPTGTRTYNAPEMLAVTEIRPEYSVNVDIYAAGLVLYEMLCGKHAFDCEDEELTLSKQIMINGPDMGNRIIK